MREIGYIYCGTCSMEPLAFSCFFVIVPLNYVVFTRQRLFFRNLGAVFRVLSVRGEIIGV